MCVAGPVTRPLAVGLVHGLTEAQVMASPGKGSVLEELGLLDDPAPALPAAPPAKQWAVKFVETKRPKHALLIVNVQNDLIDGTMALRYCAAGQEGYEVVPVVNALRRSSDFDLVAICKEWHPAEHCSFYESVTGKTLKPRPPSATGAERTKAIEAAIRALEERRTVAAKRRPRAMTRRVPARRPLKAACGAMRWSTMPMT